MFTLLPPQQKKSLYKQYRIRLISTLCFFITALFLISIGLLFPAKIYLSFERIDDENQATDLTSKIKLLNDKGLITTLTSIQSTLSVVAPDETALLPIVKIVLEKLPQGIALGSLSYTRGKDAPSSLTMQGVASTRNDLISFSKQLQSDPTFSGVVLPVSNLAKQNDVPFSLTLLGKF